MSFVVRADPNGTPSEPRVVARGTIDSVLALPGVATRGEMLLHNHPSGFLEPSGADLHVAARLHDEGVGFGIVNNDVSTLYVVVECPRARTLTRLDSLDVANLLTESGPVARVLGTAAFEDRPGQRDMAAHIADVYNDGGIALLEAGTGVGKSFAYLVPAIEWARANGERTVVSTNTINLQEQLVGKDLPILARAFSTGDRGSRSRCSRAGGIISACRGSSRRVPAKNRCSETARRRARDRGLGVTHGRRQSCRSGRGALERVWTRSRGVGLCTRLKCPHFDQCFVFAARRRAAEADVVVVNHHLLSSDLAVRIASDNWQEAAVLPPYRRLVLDEAHHLEDIAAQHLGQQVSMVGVQRLLGRLERNGRGLLPTLALELGTRDDLLASASRDLLTRSVFDALVAARRWADELFGRLARRLDAENGAGGGGGGPGGPVLRLTDAFSSDGVWREGLDVALDNLLIAFSKLRDGVETIADRLSIDDPAEMRTRLIGELRGVVRRLDAAAEGLKATLQPVGFKAPVGPAVRWMERRGRRTPNLTLSAVPLDLAPVLKAALFDRVETVVLTSAALAAGGEFTFLEERLGLSLPPSRVVVREILPSPFDFGAQCVFGIPTDIPEPRDDESGHGAAVSRVLLELAHASDGGIIALFTSYSALRRTAEAVRGEIGGRWPLLVQGEGQRDQLLRRFRDAGSAILLGTDSFWKASTFQARPARPDPGKAAVQGSNGAANRRPAGASHRAGVDGFTITGAAGRAKLKQGFGRLIRTKSDVGAVVLLDRRVVTKRYGSAMLEGLPPATKAIGNWADVRREVEEFFAMHSIGAPAHAPAPAAPVSWGGS